METAIKKDVHPSKLNRTKPSSSKKLARIIQRHQEKVAKRHLKEEQEKIATQSSYEDSVTTQTSAKNTNECKCIHDCKGKAKGYSSFLGKLLSP